MDIEIKVKIRVEAVEGETNLQHAESAREGIENALNHFQDIGFVHPLSADCSIDIASVELEEIDGVR